METEAKPISTDANIEPEPSIPFSRKKVKFQTEMVNSVKSG